LTSTLIQVVTSPSIRSQILGPVLNDLLSDDSVEARRHAAVMLSEPVPPEGPARERSLVIARSLLTRAPDAGWSVVWPLIKKDPVFGRDLLTSVASEVGYIGDAPFFGLLCEDKLATLYIWLHENFPKTKDEDECGFRKFGPRDYVARFRDRVLGHLTQRGTTAAMEAIRRASLALGSPEWLTSAYLEAERVMMERTWAPHEIGHLRATLRTVRPAWSGAVTR
jgi:hypothetical protein